MKICAVTLFVLLNTSFSRGVQLSRPADRTQRKMKKERDLTGFLDEPYYEEYKYNSRAGADGTGDLAADVDLQDWMKTKGHSRCRSSKSGKGETCAPSSVPSASPTVSSAPTRKPSQSPSYHPTASPSAAPSVSPTVSSAPSVFPSSKPSKPPTSKPSASPSASPTISSAPSNAPTTKPSSSPTDVPTTLPSAKPSPMPSNIPTLSAMPSKSPTASPSFVPSATPSSKPSSMPSKVPSASPTTEPSEMPSPAPSVMPSRGPTTNPSQSPSSIPTLSLTPTEAVFETNAGVEGGYESVCDEVPTMSGTTQEQTLVFRYNLYISPSTNAADAAYNMEAALHRGVAGNFLECNFSTDSSFFIISVVSDPTDELSNDACDVSNDAVPDEEYQCFVVEAAMSLTAFFPTSRRMQETKANSDVLDATAEYFTESMSSGEFETEEIVQVTFQGFVNVQQDAGIATPGSDVTSNGGVAAIVGGENVQPKDSNLALGSAVVGIAGVCLIIVGIVSARHRNGRQEAYLKHLEDLSEMSEISLDHEAGTAPLSSDGKVHLVMEEENYGEDDSFDDVIREIEEQDYADHDVKNCSSATCQVCRHREIRPTFISTELGLEAIADLRRVRSASSARSNYPTPDTVLL